MKIESDWVVCPECNGNTFEEKVLNIIDKRIENTSFPSSSKIPDKFILQKKIVYKCSKCGTILEF